MNEKVLDQYLMEVAECYYGYEILGEIEKGDQTIFMIREFGGLGPNRNFYDYILMVENGEVYSMKKGEKLSE